MKKLLSILFAVIMAATLAFGLVGCGNNISTYYGKTIMFTGNALPIEWNNKCQIDQGPDNTWDQDKNGFKDNKEYSFKELLTKYWEQVNFDGPWESMKGKTVDQFIAEVDRSLTGFYDNYMSLSTSLKFEFGSQSERSVKITALEDGEPVVYDAVMVETSAQLDAEKSKFDPKANLDGLFVSGGNAGRECIALIDSNKDGLYDSYASIILTAYVVNGNRTTMELSFVKNEVSSEDENSYQASVFSFGSIAADFTLYQLDTDNSLIKLPLYPELIME